MKNCMLATILLLLAGSACALAAPTPDAMPGVSFPVACSASAQADFERAVVLLHHMTYPQARAAFGAIAQRESRCAMAHWGVAMTLFQPLWPTRPGAADLQRGWDEAQQALSLAQGNARELAYAQAVASFFRDPGSADYWRRIDAWEAAMAALHAAFDDDDEGAAFYALALLASARPGPSQQDHVQRALDLLLPILRRHPGHPGAMHYIVHADDVAGRERDNLDVVRRYERVAPDNPHALHMPTHIYTRLGDWDGVVRGNLRAAAAALKYPAGDHGQWVWDEFAHATEYLVYAYLQQGDDAQARERIARLRAIRNLEPSAKSAFHLASTRARYALERHAWGEGAALVPRDPPALEWDRYPWPEAIVVFARGYSLAQLHRDGAQRDAARLDELEQRATAAGEAVFARQIHLLQLELSAAIAHAARDDAAAIDLLRQAAALERDTPKPAVTPAPTLPAAELLGDLLLELRRPGDALAAYQDSLRLYPNRFNSELGAARAQSASSNVAAAAPAYCALLRTARDGTRAQRLHDVQAFLARQRSTRQRCADLPPDGLEPAALH